MSEVTQIHKYTCTKCGSKTNVIGCFALQKLYCNKCGGEETYAGNFFHDNYSFDSKPQRKE